MGSSRVSNEEVVHVDCERCRPVPGAIPAGLFGTLGKKVGGMITGAIKGAKSPILEFGGKTSVPRVNLTQATIDALHQGATHGAVIPPSAARYSSIDLLKANLSNTAKRSFQESQVRIQAAIKAPAPPALHPSVAGLPDTEALRLLRDRAASIADRPVLVTPDAISKATYSLRAPEAAAKLQGSASAAKQLADDLAVATQSGRSLTKSEVSSVSAALRELDSARTTFTREPAYDPAMLVRQIRAESDVLIQRADDQVITALRQADSPLVNLGRRGDDYGEVLAHNDFANIRPLAGEAITGERVVLDEAGRPLIQKVIRTADGGDNYVYRELTEAEARTWTQQAAREVTESGSRNLLGAADGVAGKGASIYKTVALLSGSAVIGGVAAKLLLSPADAMPLGDDLAAYQEAVCNPESQYYDETSCAVISQVNALLQQYPESWQEVCVEGSPIYDPEMCQAIQGMAAAAEAGVPYQGGGPTEYGGTDETIDQAKIDELVATYCHPASPSYNAEACAQVKALAAKYGFSVTEPGGEDTTEQPPWAELTTEEIHAIVCDRYGNWYDADLCAEYTEYLRQQYAPSTDPSTGTTPVDAGDGTYVPGDEGYPGAGGFADGGWYGGSGGGVLYYDVEEGTTPICALDHPTCIGWFEYVGELFYWDGEEFYDSYGNLVYFVWTESDQAEYEALLASMTPTGGVVAGEQY